MFNDLFYSHSTFNIPIISHFSESLHFRHIQHVIKPRNIERGQKCRFFRTQYGFGSKLDLVPKSWNDLFYSHSTFKIPTNSLFSESRNFRHIQHEINPANIERELKCCCFLTHYRPGFIIDLVPKSWNDLFYSHSTLKIPIIFPFSESRHFSHV